MTAPTEWYKDNFLISTSPSLLQPAAINAAFDADFMYWTKSLPEDLLQKMLSKSLCFGVYELPTSSAEIAGTAPLTSSQVNQIEPTHSILTGRGGPKQIGLARLVTDEVTSAYLTDVYVLPEYRGKGLGKWLVQCVDQTLNSWPQLRRAMLISSGGAKLYRENLGVYLFEQGKNGLEIYGRTGAGSMLSH